MILKMPEFVGLVGMSIINFNQDAWFMAFVELQFRSSTKISMFSEFFGPSA